MQQNWHAEAIALYDAGLSYQKIAKKFGKSYFATFHAVNNSRTAHGGKPALDQGPNAAFDPDQVREIRRRIQAGEGLPALAREYGVTWQTIKNIHTRKNYKYVD